MYIYKEISVATGEVELTIHLCQQYYIYKKKIYYEQNKMKYK